MTRDTSIPIDSGTLDLAAKRVRIWRTPAREDYPVESPRYQYKTPVPQLAPKPASDHPWRGYQAEAISRHQRTRRTTKRQRQAVTMIAGGTREPARIPSTRERWTARCREEWRRAGGRYS